MPVSEEQREEYGRTVADVLAFLPRAWVILVAVPVTDGTVTYLGLSPATVLPAVAAHANADSMPCKFDSVRRELVIGSRDAINHAAQVR